MPNDDVIVIEGEEYYGDTPGPGHSWTEEDDEEVATYAARHNDENTDGGVYVGEAAGSHLAKK